MSGADGDHGVGAATMFPDLDLRAGRVLLRPLRPTDAGDVAASIDAEILRWLPLLPDPYRVEHAELFCTESAPQQRRTGRGVVGVLAVDGRLAGLLDLKKADWSLRTVEIGYWTAAWARGHGHTTAAVRLLSRWALVDQGFRRVELRAAADNLASQRVAAGAGFRHEGVLRQSGHSKTAEACDLVVFSRVWSDL